MSVLKAQEVTKWYDDLEVLRGVTVEIEPGQVKVIIGPSGSGKSTLLRCINLLEHVDEGTIVVDGQQITGSKVDVNALRQKIGDPDFNPGAEDRVRAMTTKDFAGDLWRQIGDRATPTEQVMPAEHGTTHIGDRFRASR